MRSRVRVRNRFAVAVVTAVGALCILPAVSQAATSPPGIASSGTFSGTFNGNPVTVSVSTVQGCLGGSSLFAAVWTGGGSFRETAVSSEDQCSFFDATGKPQFLSFDGVGTTGGTVGGELQGPTSPFDPSQVSLSIQTSGGGDLEVGLQSPGPLGTSPGRVQPFTSASPPPTSSSTQFDSVFCPAGQRCDTGLSASDRKSDFSVVANPNSSPTQNAGTLTESVDFGTPLSCAGRRFGGYTAFDDNWYGFSITGSAEKVATYDIFNVSPDQNPQFCFGAKVTFQTTTGSAAAGTLPDGSPGFIGLLPTCANAPTDDPCVQSEAAFSNDSGSGTEFVVDVPQAFSDDPWGHI